MEIPPCEDVGSPCATAALEWPRGAPGQLCTVAPSQGPFCAFSLHFPHGFGSSDSSTGLSTCSFILLVVNSEMKCVFRKGFSIFKK